MTEETDGPEGSGLWSTAGEYYRQSYVLGEMLSLPPGIYRQLWTSGSAGKESACNLGDLG